MLAAHDPVKISSAVPLMLAAPEVELAKGKTAAAISFWREELGLHQLIIIARLCVGLLAGGNRLRKSRAVRTCIDQRMLVDG
jgi:hypothetical protein